MISTRIRHVRRSSKSSHRTAARCTALASARHARACCHKALRAAQPAYSKKRCDALACRFVSRWERAECCSSRPQPSFSWWRLRRTAPARSHQRTTASASRPARHWRSPCRSSYALLVARARRRARSCSVRCLRESSAHADHHRTQLVASLTIPRLVASSSSSPRTTTRSHQRLKSSMRERFAAHAAAKRAARATRSRCITKRRQRAQSTIAKGRGTME